jgi:hypothetical protein
MLKEKNNLGKLSRKKGKVSQIFLSTWAAAFFNISITFNSTAEVIPGREVGGACSWLGSSLEYPRVRGVRNIVHGYQRGDEFPTWSFEVARCVFVYTYSRPSLPSRGGTYSELVCLGIYKFITIYIYSHICI